MPREVLNPKILDRLHKKTGLAKSTIRSSISRLRTNYASCTINAVAQLFALKRGCTLMQLLSADDKRTLPHTSIIKQPVKIKEQKGRRKERIIELIKYDTDDYFKKGHINEINRAYTKGCYTSVHILTRKFIENLIREILASKYPSNTKKNKELYYDTARKRFKDFSVVLKTLYDKRHDFDPDEQKAIERLYTRVKKFKDASNDATHSWYHLIETKKEIDDLNIPAMVALICRLEERRRK